MQVLLPALRSDMASLPLPSDRLQPANTAQPSDQCTDSHSSGPILSPSLLDRQHCTKGFAQSIVSTTATPTAGHCTHPGSQSGSQQSSAVSTASMLEAEAAESTAAESTAAESTASATAAESTASATPAAADDLPIQPLNQQTAIGACVSPKVGRRTTPFSTSEPSHQSVASSSQDMPMTATEASTQHDTPMPDAVAASRFVGDAKESAEGGQQDTPMQVAQQGTSSSIADECYGSCADVDDPPVDSGQRPYLTCCVRLSVEKEPHRWDYTRSSFCMVCIHDSNCASSFVQAVVLFYCTMWYKGMKIGLHV